MSTFVVGVSGGIGSGKTTVTDLFAKQGIDIIDADIIARQVVEPNSVGYKAIIAKLGTQILDDKGWLNRALLRQYVFSQPELKTWLNDLLHPLIREQMRLQTLQATSAYCMLSVPLLVENKLSETVDRILIVDVSEETQLKRSVARDNSNAEQISAIMRAQASRAERLSVADDVIVNEGLQQELVEKILTLHHFYIKLASQK